ncbi:hypothetical protein MRBLWO14_002827 [Microbacterium sp. LWO14-1.2]
MTQYEEWVELVADTLVVRGDDDVPARYQQKVWPIPHLNMVMAATGTAEVASAWYAFVTQHPQVRDIDDIDSFATETLRNIRADVAERHGDAGSSTLHHFGFPTGSDKAVSYIYSSMGGRNFESERFQGARFIAKPGPQTFAPDVPVGPEEKIAFAYRLRQEQEELIAQGKPGTPFGGELQATLLEPGGIRTMTWHRFPDYDETLETVPLPDVSLKHGNHREPHPADHS